MHRDKKRAVAVVDGRSALCSGDPQHIWLSLIKVFKLSVAVHVIGGLQNR